MDLSKLKGRAAFPFETIGVAIAFSPRLEDILGEAARLAKELNAQLIIFHIGERTRTKESKLDDAFRNLGIDEAKTRVIWHEGNPVTTLLELCKLNIVDLLVMGALRKENVIRFYLGSVARRISRTAKCSVLLLTDPTKKGTKFRKIMVNGIDNPKTEHSIGAAVYFARHVNGKEITVVNEVDQSAYTMAITDQNTVGEALRMKREMQEEQLGKVDAIISRLQQSVDFEIQKKLVKGKAGYAIKQYAESKKADLVVINSPDVKYGLLDRIFPHDLEYILEDLSSNILIVHSRIPAK